MRIPCVIGVYAIATILVLPMEAQTYDLHFSTYFGGTNMDQMRDIAVDNNGNIYITGGTESPDYPVTPGAYDTTHNGWFDVFVTKFAPDGNLIQLDSKLLADLRLEETIGLELKGESDAGWQQRG